MGFFKKLFKGVKKVFKKIGRGIKKVVGKVGKFMNKLGWVGQLALQFILPGVGTLLTAGLKGLGAIGGVLGAVAKPLSWVMNQAGKFAKVGTNVFRTVTSGIKSFVGNMGKAVLSKLPGGSKLLGAMNMESIGFKDAWGKVQTEIGSNFKGILDPFKVAKGKSVLGKGRTLESISKSTGLSVEELGKYNPDMVAGVDADSWGSIIAGTDDRVHTKLFDITLPETVGIDFSTGKMTLPEAPGEITLPETVADFSTGKMKLPTFPKAGEVTIGKLKAPEVKLPYKNVWNPEKMIFEDVIDHEAISKGDYGIPKSSPRPSLLDPYGKAVATAAKKTLFPEEEEVAKAEDSGKVDYLFDADKISPVEEERLAATDVNFGALAGEIASNVRANYDRLMREGGMFGYSQTVYDEWSRTKPRLPAIGSIA